MIAGFGGWPNAGEVSTWVVAYLVRAFGAAKCAEIRSEPFYDLVQQRPVVSVQGGRVQNVEFPRNAFYAAEIPAPLPRDMVLFLGQEPHLQWPQFVETLLDVAQELGVTEIVTVGGLYDNIPHTVPPRITGLTNEDRWLDRFASLQVQPADYDGPMSIHTLLLTGAGKRRLPAASLWGHVPYYIQSSNAKTCLAVLQRIQSVMGFELDLKEVRRASELLDDEVDKIIQSKPELREYIQGLEHDFTATHAPEQPSQPPPRHHASGEKIIRIDPFLRRD
jgi:proteasome assembly chaperone (PAC2) family protein